MPGTLFVVATPIGNLEDLTFRALRVLREVDVIAAEDTRRTAKLLAHYEIKTSMVSLHEHNEHREAPRLVNRLTAGESIAVVSDAGTPGISDPGSKLVAVALRAGIRVVPVPGPSAVTAALSASGLDASTFLFLGFPPSSGAARARWFDRITQERGSIVFFEAPHRIRRTMNELSALAKRPILIHRELTKIHEQLVISPNTSQLAERGEFVVVVGPEPEAISPQENVTDPVKVHRLLSCLLDAGIENAESAIAQILRLPANAVRKLAKKGRYLVNQQNGNAD